MIIETNFDTSSDSNNDIWTFKYDKNKNRSDNFEKLIGFKAKRQLDRLLLQGIVKKELKSRRPSIPLTEISDYQTNQTFVDARFKKVFGHSINDLSIQNELV